MAETSVKIQLSEEQLKKLDMPKPLLGMHTSNSAMNMGDFSYLFESDRGDFVEFFFDMASRSGSYFIIIKIVANTMDVLDAYASYYREVEKLCPVNMIEFKKLDRKLVTRMVFKEHDPDLLKFFQEKRKGEYRGMFIEKPKE